MGVLSISKGNAKLGSIQSISLPSVVTCRKCDCQAKCYARRMERFRKTVAEAYKNNFEVLQSDPNTYWREIEAAIMLSRFFRFHVSGDIPDDGYFDHMVEVAKRQRHCEILCFTKKYEIVNDYVALHGGEIETALPSNLHIIFSAWVGLEMANPFLFPEAHVRYKDGTTTAGANAKECKWNCTECAATENGCWTLTKGEQVIFHEH